MVSVSFWPLYFFLDLSSAGKPMCIVFSHIFFFWLNLSQNWWLRYFGTIFSFCFLSLSGSDFRSQSGRAKQQHATSLCLWRLQVYRQEKPYESGLWMADPNLRLLTTFICSVWTESDWASTYPQLNKKLSLIRAQMELAVMVWHKKV